MPISRTIAAGAVLGFAVLAPLMPHTAHAAQNDTGWQHRGHAQSSRISVESAQHPRLARKIEHHLAQQLRSSYGRIAPIHIQLGNTRINPRLRIQDRRQVSQRLGHGQRGKGFNQRCGPQSLVYDAIRGQVRASYSLRYNASSRAFGQIREKAKGKVRRQFSSADNAGIVSRCGWQPANKRQLKHLAQFGQSGLLKPMRIVQDALARDIAAEISRDLRGHLRHHKAVQFGQTYKGQKRGQIYSRQRAFSGRNGS